MDNLYARPNLLFLVLVKNKSVKFLLVVFNSKSDFYGNKLLKSRTEVFKNEDGSQLWYLDGYIHRDGGPAHIDFRNGVYDEWWCQHGFLHREDGPAVIKRSLFNQHEWRLNEQLHRTTLDANGHVEPALYNDIGDKYWFKNGKLHRNIEEGPASMKTDALHEWWVDGVEQPEPRDYYERFDQEDGEI